MSIALATQDQATALTVPSRGFVQLTTLQEAKEFAELLAKSDFVPKDFRGKAGEIVIAMQYGLELGVPPLQALQNIAVINGRPSVWGDLVPAIVLAQPDCEDFIEEKPQGETPDTWVATCTIKRRGKTATVYTFSWADAKRAGLAGKTGPWTQYPKRQLQMRARGFCARDAYPDRFKGLITAEEALDYPTPATEPSEPRRVGGSSTVSASSTSSSPNEVASGSGVPTQTATEAAPQGSGSPDPPKPQPASVAPAELIERPVTIKDTKALKTNSGNFLYEITTSRGVFYTQNEPLYKSAASCEGVDTLLAVTYRWAKKDAERVKLLVKLDLHEETPATSVLAEDTPQQEEATLS